METQKQIDKNGGEKPIEEEEKRRFQEAMSKIKEKSAKVRK